MNIKKLSLLTGVLFILSFILFMNENKRGTDLLTGSDYIKGLDINKLQKISLTFKDQKSLVLARDGQKFVIENHQSYPAALDKVNDLIYQIASLQVREKISSGADADELKKYELDDQSQHILIELHDNDGNKTVAFKVGKGRKGKGKYLHKVGSQDIYLSQNSLHISSSFKDFLNTEILALQEKNIEQIDLLADQKVTLLKKENDFVMTTPKGKKLKKEKAQEYFKNLSSVKFVKFYRPGVPEVESLNFSKDLRIKLKSKLVYKVALAEKKENYYVKLNALVDEIPSEIVINRDDGADRLKNIENMAKAQGVADRFNREKGAWIYKVDKDIYEKMAKNASFFL